MADQLDAVRGSKGSDGLLGCSEHYIKPVYAREIGPLWKAYVERRGAYDFHFVIRRLGHSGSHNLCADFQAFPGSRELEAKYVDAARSGSGIGTDKDWIEGLVFVPVGEF